MYRESSGSIRSPWRKSASSSATGRSPKRSPFFHRACLLMFQGFDDRFKRPESLELVGREPDREFLLKGEKDLHVRKGVPLGHGVT